MNRSEVLRAFKNAAASEAQAIALLEKRRWKGETECPWCSSMNVYCMTDRAGKRNKYYRWRCRGCNKMFTVRTGTILEDTRVPLRVWIYGGLEGVFQEGWYFGAGTVTETQIAPSSALPILRRISHVVGELRVPEVVVPMPKAEGAQVEQKFRYRLVSRRPLSND